MLGDLMSDQRRVRCRRSDVDFAAARPATVTPILPAVDLASPVGGYRRI